MKKKITVFLLASVLTVFSAACSSEPPKDENVSKGPDIVISPVEESSSSESSSSASSENTAESSSASSSESFVQSSSASSSEESAFEEETDDSVLILVNPKNYIPEDYTVELVTVQGKYKMDEKAAQSAIDLLEAAKEAGFNMLLCSAYRTVAKSEELYNRKVNEFINAGYDKETAKVEAARWVAPPGTSEHHTGLAMDLVSADYWNYYTDLEHDYENFDSFGWLYEHCAEFGFILRYPKDKQEITGITYEPWHYRYVGKEAAAYIMENGLCLEEYLGETG